MAFLSDILGNTFDRLTVIERKGSNVRKEALWLCQCSCGNKTIVRGVHLIHGRIKSCGCLKTEGTIKRMTKHGGYINGKKSRVLNTHAFMMQRCYNPNRPDYKHYGGRGITVKSEWHDFVTFREWAFANGYREGLTIERIDFNGNYEPSNCMWIPRSEQPKNTRRNHVVTINDETYYISEWLRIKGIKMFTFYGRLRRGWSIERALTQPVL